MAGSFLLLYLTLTLPDFPNLPNLKCPASGVHSTFSRLAQGLADWLGEVLAGLLDILTTDETGLQKAFSLAARRVA